MPQKITTQESSQLLKPPHKWQLRKRKLTEESNYGAQREQTKERVIQRHGGVYHHLRFLNKQYRLPRKDGF